MIIDHLIEPAALKYALAVAFALALAGAPQAEEETKKGAADIPSGPEIWAVQINVSDIDEAIDFCTNVLGLEVAAREYYPQVVSLKNDGAHVLLYNVRERNDLRPMRSSPYCNWQVPDLDKTLEKLKTSKATDITGPEKFPLGMSAGFRDPFGNYMHVMELDKTFGSVEQTQFFNFAIPITDKDEALEFYGALGFESYTDKYWPPVVPLSGQGMEFILHQSDEVIAQEYPGKVGAFVILEVPNIYESVKQLEALGMTFLYDKPQTHAPVGAFIALRDPFGNIVELIQSVPTPFDAARERAEKDKASNSTN